MIEARYLFFILFGGIFGWVAHGLYRKHCHKPRGRFAFAVGLPYTIDVTATQGDAAILNEKEMIK